MDAICKPDTDMERSVSVKKYKILQNTSELVNEKACIASKNMSLDILRVNAPYQVP